MIIQREVSHSNDKYPNDEVARLLLEIEKMKQVSRVNDERTRLMSEELSEKINLLNVQVESVKNSEIIVPPESSYCHVRKYPQIQIIDDSDDVTISVVEKPSEFSFFFYFIF